MNVLYYECSSRVINRGVRLIAAKLIQIKTRTIKATVYFERIFQRKKAFQSMTNEVIRYNFSS